VATLAAVASADRPAVVENIELKELHVEASESYLSVSCTSGPVLQHRKQLLLCVWPACLTLS
jgi:hypothetical protein